MKLSLVVSILIHAIVLGTLLFVFKIVPEVRLPQKIYSVRIIRAVTGAKKESPAAEKKAQHKKPRVIRKKVPARKKKKAPPKKKPEKKPEKAAAEKEKPMDVTVKKEGNTSVAVDAERFPFSYYIEAVQGKVSRNWFGAVAKGGEGLQCVVYFRLQRDGRVEDVTIEKSSGSTYFDQSALRAVRSSSPFPPLPRAFVGSYLGIHFTFIQKG
ncbi:MAG: hypothetical protein B6D63_03055 [Candidatus Latescibacteria bacterium 4484_7]|nr:MAG: hypothetical protein B6D63_03055 [Candidatus Latescibacteria bacterium 4484_7]